MQQFTFELSHIEIIFDIFSTLAFVRSHTKIVKYHSKHAHIRPRMVAICSLICKIAVCRFLELDYLFFYTLNFFFSSLSQIC